MSRLRLLLSVDDSDADQYLSEARIRDHDPAIEVRRAYDGAEALEVLRDPSYRPDLILLDINMPGMGGLEFLEAYTREFTEEARSPVVMLSSSKLEHDRERALSHGPVRGYLVKPIPADWAELVSEMLGASRTG